MYRTDKGNIFYVYQLRVVGERKPFYVGKGFGGRADVHFEPNSLKARSHKNHTIKKAWSNGKDVLIEYLHSDVSDEQACKLECQYIARFGRRDLGTGCLTNLTDGGDGPAGYKLTAAQRRRKSEALRGHVVSHETRQRISAANTGIVWSAESRLRVGEQRRGRKRSAESVAKQKATRKRNGYRPTPEHIEKLRMQAGWKHSDEARLKMSLAAKARVRKPLSEETKAKISADARARAAQKALTGNKR